MARRTAAGVPMPDEEYLAELLEWLRVLGAA